MTEGKTQVVSFSGGRTSAYLVWLMEQQRKITGADVRYVFMDTGAEHPKTYEFIRNVVKHFGIDLTCLQIVVNPQLRKANSYKVVTVDDIKYDLSIFHDICRKYGTPYVHGAFCTRTMKIETFERYCKDTFGGGAGYTSWIGIRRDEQRRVWGEKAHLILNRMNYDNDGMHYILTDLLNIVDSSMLATELRLRLIYEHAFLPEQYEPVINRITSLKKSGQRFLSEISDYTKQDVLKWWKLQKFDLEIEEHLGNCVFCIKKGINKIALAARDELEMATQFIELLNADDVRVVERRQQANKIMYRGNNSLESIIDQYADYSREEIAATIRGNKAYESGSCSESCEPFFCGQLDMFDEELS